ncbi:MAG: hypothetical protein ACRENP_15655 [Longimicrobiales bacterium]
MPLKTFCAACALILPLGATAQTGVSKADPNRAEVMLARAERLSGRADYPERARLYEQAARALARTDRRASVALFMAASIQRDLGNAAPAQHLFVESAEIAAGRGDLSESANAYLQALSIALRRSATSDARRLIDRILALANSPRLSEADRNRIIDRVSRPVGELVPQRLFMVPEGQN